MSVRVRLIGVLLVLLLASACATRPLAHQLQPEDSAKLRSLHLYYEFFNSLVTQKSERAFVYLDKNIFYLENVSKTFACMNKTQVSPMLSQRFATASLKEHEAALALNKSEPSVFSSYEIKNTEENLPDYVQKIRKELTEDDIVLWVELAPGEAATLNFSRAMLILKDYDKGLAIRGLMLE